jgi:hypothetical protein
MRYHHPWNASSHIRGCLGHLRFWIDTQLYCNANGKTQ